MPERLIYLAGAASRRGEGRRHFAGLLHYLSATAGLEDAAEASYCADRDGRALDYDRTDTSGPITDSVRAVQSILGRHRRDLGLGGRIHLLGWSLGGVALFEAAAGLLDADSDWAGAVATIVTYSSPLLGCDVGGIVKLGEVFAGTAGRELCHRGADLEHRGRALASAARLRAAGTRLVTLGSAVDVVVTAADSVIPVPPASPDAWVLRPTPRLGADFGERHLGHGAILNDSAAWKLTLEAIRG